MSKDKLGNVHAVFFVNLDRNTLSIVEYRDLVVFCVDIDLNLG